MKKTDPTTIAERASELFVRRGYTNTSMAEIGSSCGILKGSIYHHFESKEKILLFILKQLQNDLRNVVFSIADNDRLSAVDRLRKINEFLKDYFLDKRACFVAMLGMETEHICEDARSIMNDIFKDWKKTYIKLFRNHYSQYMAEIHATNSIIFIEGAIIWMRVTQDDAPLKRVFKTVEQHLLNTVDAKYSQITD